MLSGNRRIGNAIAAISVALLWGCTNTLIKKGSEGVASLPPQSNALLTFLSEILYLFTRWQYVVPFLLNMCGSVLFYWTLANAGTTMC